MNIKYWNVFWGGEEALFYLAWAGESLNKEWFWSGSLVLKRVYNFTTSGHFSQLVLTFLLENPICCMSYHSKDVNSRGIKHFKGRKQPSFYFSRSRQSLARAKKNVYVRETVFSHFKKRELTLLPWFVSFVHTEWTNFSN